MKISKIIIALAMILISASSYAQKWSDLSKEDKMMKLKSFRDDNQNYLKTTLGLSAEQIDDVDNVNLCYLGSLDRINRYAKDDAAKEKYAKAATAARSAQLDAIMGADKRKQFSQYVQDKLKKEIVPIP